MWRRPIGKVVPDLTISNLAGAGPGFGDNSFWGYSLMKLMASTMLSAAIKMQYSSVLPLLRHYLPVLGEICRTAMNFVYPSSQ